MRDFIKNLGNSLKIAIEEAAIEIAYSSYDLANCSAYAEYSGIEAEVIFDKYGTHRVSLLTNSSYPNIETALSDFLDKYAETYAMWYDKVRELEEDRCYSECDPAFNSWAESYMW